MRPPWVGFIDKQAQEKDTIGSGAPAPNRFGKALFAMTVSLPLGRALASPVRAVPFGAVRRPVGTTPAGKPIVANRKAAVPQVASGLSLTKPQASAKPATLPASKATVLLSSALHLALFGGWAVLAAPARPLAPPDLDLAEVELVSEAQFAALTAPQPQIVALPAALPPPEFPAEPEPALPVADASPAPQAAPLIAPDLAEAAPDPAPDLSADLPEPLVSEPPPKQAEAAPKQAPKPAAKKVAKKAPEKAASPAPAAKTPAAKTPAARPSTAAPAKSASKGEAKALKADWGGKLRSRINRKLATPPGKGTVKVRLVVAPSGALLSAGIAQSSGAAALDAAALKAVKAAAPYPRAPKGLTEASYSFTLPITFKG